MADSASNNKNHVCKGIITDNKATTSFGTHVQSDAIQYRGHLHDIRR